MPQAPVKIMMNVGNPELAFEFQRLPNEGVGLARLEFIINRKIGVHPKALLDYPDLPGNLKLAVEQHAPAMRVPSRSTSRSWPKASRRSPRRSAPKPVIVRLSDFKSNEYSNLIGGSSTSRTKRIPMLGFRGASRYISTTFRDCFELECRAHEERARRDGPDQRRDHGAVRAHVAEAKQVIELLAQERPEARRERPAHHHDVRDADERDARRRFLEHFDGFSIGSNDMTQLTLALDRDSGVIADAFDERDGGEGDAALAISACRKAGKYVGICGQGPSDHPDLAQWLVEQGIESMSLNPDTVVETWLYLAREAKNASWRD